MTWNFRFWNNCLVCVLENAVDDSESNEFWLNHTPNYFFPKSDHYPDLKTAAVVFLASAMSLVMLILLLIIILYRMNHHVREQRELQSQLRTISELLGILNDVKLKQFHRID